MSIQFDRALSVNTFSFSKVGRYTAIPLRLIVGYGFMAHGYAKVVHGPEHFVAILRAIGVPAPELMGWATILVELAGGLAVLVGAFVPLASVPMAAVLLVAMFTVHLPYGFSSIKLQAVTAAGAQFGPPGYETDLLYLACLTALVLGGSGPFAVVGLLARAKVRLEREATKTRGSSSPLREPLVRFASVPGESAKSRNDRQPTLMNQPATFFRGLYESHLEVADLEKAMRFYGHVLGLELGHTEPERRAAFYWIGRGRRTMLGLWEKPPWVVNGTENTIRTQHIAFGVEFEDLDSAIQRAKEKGIEPRNFFGQITDEPSVFAWMPAASIYFNDIDGHLLEFIAEIKSEPAPDLGIVSLTEWNETHGA